MKKVLSVFLAILLTFSSVSGVITLIALAEDENLWIKITSTDVVKFSAPYIGLNSSSSTGFSFWNPEYIYFAVKMPKLEAGAEYKFSCYVYAQNAELRITDFAILNQNEFEKAQANSANYYSFPSSVKKLASSALYSKNATAISPIQFTADGSEYYLGFRCGGVNNKSGTVYLNVSGISLTKVVSNTIDVTEGTIKVNGVPNSKASSGDEVSIAFNNTSDKIFEKWEVSSSNVTLADEKALTTTFTMPNEPVFINAVYSTNLWANVVSTDVKSYSGYGSFTSYIGSKKQLNLNTMFWQSVSVKLPELKKQTTYEISMERSFGTTIQNNGTASLSNITMNLVSETQHQSASNSIPKEYIKQLCNNSKLSEDISTEFTTGNDRTYYLVICVRGTYGDLCLEDLILKDISIPGVKTAYNNVAAIRAAGGTDGSINKNGIRIYNSIEKEWVKNSDIVEYGSIAIYKKKLQKLYDEKLIKSEEISFKNLSDYIGKACVVGVAYRADGVTTITGNQSICKLWGITDDAMLYTSYLTGISNTNFDEDICIVSYALDEKGNAYYGNVIELCIFDVVKSIDDAAISGVKIPFIDKMAFNEFVGTALDEYKIWYENLVGTEPLNTKFNIN